MRTEQEFHAAAEQYLTMVYRIALNWFGCVHDAEDAAQEVMLRLWKAESVPTDEAHLRHWLVRVTVNVCKDLSRPPWRFPFVSLADVAGAVRIGAGVPGGTGGDHAPSEKVPHPPCISTTTRDIPSKRSENC